MPAYLGTIPTDANGTAGPGFTAAKATAKSDHNTTLFRWQTAYGQAFGWVDRPAPSSTLSPATGAYSALVPAFVVEPIGNGRSRVYTWPRAAVDFNEARNDFGPTPATPAWTRSGCSRPSGSGPHTPS